MFDLSAPAVHAIVAMTKNRVIGKENHLPWHLPEDLKHFNRLTKGNPVIMGSKTYWSLPDKYRPLPDRQNIVISRSPVNFEDQDVLATSDPIGFIHDFRAEELELASNELWVIGGSQIYELTMPLIDRLYITMIEEEHEGDAFFPKYEDKFELDSSEEHDGYIFTEWKRKQL